MRFADKDGWSTTRSALILHNFLTYIMKLFNGFGFEYEHRDKDNKFNCCRCIFPYVGLWGFVNKIRFWITAFALHIMLPLLLYDIYSVLVSVSCPKALYHLESDNLFRITVVVADWLGWNPYHRSSFCTVSDWMIWKIQSFKLLELLVSHCWNDVVVN